MVFTVYLSLMGVVGHENDGMRLLCLLPIIKVSLADSRVMGKRQTVFFMSVFCHSMDSGILPLIRVKVTW